MNWGGGEPLHSSLGNRARLHLKKKKKKNKKGGASYTRKPTVLRRAGEGVRWLFKKLEPTKKKVPE